MLHRTPMSMIKKPSISNKPVRSLTPSRTLEDNSNKIEKPLDKQEEVKETKEEESDDKKTEDGTKDESITTINTSKEHLENWSGANLETLSQWIQISSLQIEVLDLAIKYFRSIVRRNVLLGLVFSTASGSISISQLNSQYQAVFLNVIFTIMSFSIAIFTGLIKIYQVQERLEEFIQLKQEWISFSVVITAEVQLPVVQRKKAIDLITKNKNKYLDLLKRDVDIPNFIKGKAYKNLYHDRHKQAYLKNCERHKMLKEIWACADDTYFSKAFDRMDNNILQYEDEKKDCTWTNCFCIMLNNIGESILETYKYFANHKDKYIGEKTALSNIILTVIMEEENYQRSKQIVELMNEIQKRYNKIKGDKYKAIELPAGFQSEEV